MFYDIVGKVDMIGAVMRPAARIPAVRAQAPGLRVDPHISPSLPSAPGPPISSYGTSSRPAPPPAPVSIPAAVPYHGPTSYHPYPYQYKPTYRPGAYSPYPYQHKPAYRPEAYNPYSYVEHFSPPPPPPGMVTYCFVVGPIREPNGDSVWTFFETFQAAQNFANMHPGTQVKLSSC